MKHLLILTIAIALLTSKVIAQQYDVCVYGGTSAGVIAAYTAARQNKKVILVEPGKHLGGLSSGGLGYTDIGNKYVVTGLARDFYRRVGKHYGKFETWIFEPHVAEEVFNNYIKETNVAVLYQHRIIAADKQGASIKNITVEDAKSPSSATNKVIAAKLFIDCSYEGDLMAKANVTYTIGREDNSTYNETWNGSQLLDKHQFPDGIDPYKIPGDSSSGLVWGISTNTLLPNGTGNKMVQTYNYRLCLTNNPNNRIEITKPEGYDPSMFELLVRYLNVHQPKELNDAVIKIDYMPNQKTDINNNGPFSTDMIGMNYNYPDGDYATRQQILQQHELYTKSLLYFLGHDERLPQHLRTEMLQWGYPKDEYMDNNNFTPQAYIRESRRMVGSYVMTQNNCEGRATVDDGVGMAAYTMDSHNCERLVVNGMVKNEGDVQKGGFGPYPVSYRAIIPKAEECNNLLVPVCLSASHIAYGSIRMEPVFMVLAQSGAAAACMAIDNKKTVQEIDVKKLQQLLLQNPLMDGSTPEVLADNDDSMHATFTDGWLQKKQGGYGPSWLVASSSDAEQSIIFKPEIQTSGGYRLYTYMPYVDSAATQTHYHISTANTNKDVYVKPQAKIEGQTSGEWILLGTFNLNKGSNTTITISNKGADGYITADAILCVPAKK